MSNQKSGRDLLDVKDLWVRFNTHHGVVEAVRGISFTIGQEKVGIVGESGSGKTVTGRSILRLTPKMASVTAERINFDGIDLRDASEEKMCQVRGRRISMIMQDPKYSLNPVRRVGRQIAEAFTIHRKVSRVEAKERTLEMLNAVRIRDPRRVYEMYPHEVSGGMGQRIMIAMMMIPEPDLIIADEPTSALDVTVRMRVLAILDDLVAERGLGLMFISHDLNLVATFCDRVLIMYAGRIVESCLASELRDAEHPYTRGLLNALPRINARRRMLPVLDRDPAWRDVPQEP
jgi:peptide/nickel transport system ATP-binding protein